MSLIKEVIEKVKEKNPAQPEFHQAVEEVMLTLEPTVDKHPEFVKARVYERIVEPDRQIIFRVPWEDDKGNVQVNRGMRIEFNNSIGPYKGGLRFHPSVYEGIIKFLGFEQVFKNSLTTLPMGGAKGGSDFDPKGKSDAEVMRFCYSFMRELFRHVGPNTDVPAGDIGVGGREIGYLLGMYKKITNEHSGGVLTGKALEWGGSLIRPEATGYGNVYFAAEMLATKGESFEGKTVVVSGSGNVAQFTIQKINELGGKVISISDSTGTVIDMDGIKGEKWDFLMELKNVKRGRVKEYAEKYGVDYYDGKSVWEVVKEHGIKHDVSLPSATQNEIDGNLAQALVNNGCICVSEGANMPSTLEAIKIYQDNGVLYGPAKAANAGGVAVSGLEMSQNSLRYAWTREEVDSRLLNIMKSIHKASLDAAEAYGKKGDYLTGANIAGFIKVAKAMVAFGIV